MLISGFLRVAKESKKNDFTFLLGVFKCTKYVQNGLTIMGFKIF